MTNPPVANKLVLTSGLAYVWPCASLRDAFARLSAHCAYRRVESVWVLNPFGCSIRLGAQSVWVLNPNRMLSPNPLLTRRRVLNRRLVLASKISADNAAEAELANLQLLCMSGRREHERRACEPGEAFHLGRATWGTKTPPLQKGRKFTPIE